MKTTYRLIGAFFGVSVLAISCVADAEDSCKNWSTASVDPTKGKYPIELRTCDLTYGLSAYIEIRNSSGSRVALSYRIITNDEKYKDGDIILEPDTTTQAGNCQACAKRHAGFKSWEILTAREAIEDTSGTQSNVSAAPLPSFMDKPAGAKAPVAESEKRAGSTKPLIQPNVEKPIAEKPVVAPAPVLAPPVPAPVAEQVKPAATPATAAPEPEKTQEGFRAEDGTIIPWDKLPPEFRPRK
jgi:hypothetical protein